MAIRKKRKKRPVASAVPERILPPERRTEGSSWFGGVEDRLTDPTSQSVTDTGPLAGRNLLTGARESDNKPQAKLTPAAAFVKAVISGDREEIKDAYANLSFSDAPAIKTAFSAMPTEQRASVISHVQTNKDLFSPIAVTAFETFMKTAPAPPAGTKPLNFDPVALEGDEALAAMGAAMGYVAPTTGSIGNGLGAARDGGARHHSGVDFRAADGSKAVAVIGGKVLHTGNDPGGYDHYAIVQGSDGNMYRYATHGSLDVKVGQEVAQGQPIGTINRGHLHFEVAQPSDAGWKSLKAGGDTIWRGKGPAPTTDPLKVLGIAPHSVVAAGKPVGEARPAMVADIPAAADPFGVERMKALTVAGVPEGTDLASLPAGMRNYNPGNLKYSGSAWQREHFPGIVGPSENTDQGDPQIKFATALDGMKAAATLARTKFDGGADTVRALIAGKNGWTPGYDPAAVNIAATMGVSPDERIDLSQPAVMQSFLRAVVTQEHGPSAKLYSDALIAAAVNGGAADMVVDSSSASMIGSAKSVGGETLIANALQARGKMEKGSRNIEANKALQSALNELGATDRFGNPLKVDGVYGNRTKEAVKNYQSKNGLVVDGVVGPQTFGQIKSDMTEAAPPQAPRSAEAMKALGLTPQEIHLYEHHLDNLANGKSFKSRNQLGQEEGTTSTIRQMTVEQDGRVYNIPTVWDGKVLTPHEAMARATAEGGLKAWPSYPSEAAAEARYNEMHGAMELDVQSEPYSPARGAFGLGQPDYTTSLSIPPSALGFRTDERDYAAGAAAAAVTVDPVVARAFVPSGKATLDAALGHPDENFNNRAGWDPAAARIADTLRDAARMDAEVKAAMAKAGKTSFAGPVQADAGVRIPKSFSEWIGERPNPLYKEHQAPEEKGLLADAGRAWESVKQGFDVESWLSSPTVQDSPYNSSASITDPYRPTGGSILTSSSSGDNFDSFASGMSSAYQSVSSGGSVFSTPASTYAPGGSNTTVQTDAAGRVLGGI